MPVFLLLVVWLLIAVLLRSLVVRLSPGLRDRRLTNIAIGVVALALAWLTIRQLPGVGAPDGGNDNPQTEFAAGVRVPPPLPFSAATLATLPFTSVDTPGFTARAAFVEASRRRPLTVMALRLAAESTLHVQRYLVLLGDSLQLVVDERRRSDGKGALYAYPLEEVRLGRCKDGGRSCSVVEATSPAATDDGYRVLGRFPGDTSFAVRF